MSKEKNTEKAQPFSIRLTSTEKAGLTAKAAGQPLGIFIRSLILNESVRARTVRQAPVRDGESLGRLLAVLGKSRLASNVNQLAKAAHLGSLPVTKETERDLQQASAFIAEMRTLLLRALGQQAPVEVLGPGPKAGPTFGEASDAKRFGSTHYTPLPLSELFTTKAGDQSK